MTAEDLSERELRDLARRLLVSSDPALVVESIQAGTVLCLGFELLRDLGLPVGDRPLRDTELAEDLAAFRPGDRLLTPGEGWDTPTDLADVAADVQRAMLDVLDRSRDLLRALTSAGLRKRARGDVLYVLDQLSPAQLEQLSTAARQAPPAARPRPARGKKALTFLERRRRQQAATLRRLAEAFDYEADQISEQLNGTAR